MEQTDSVGIEGCVFPGVNGMMPQENGQEQCVGVYTIRSRLSYKSPALIAYRCSSKW